MQSDSRFHDLLTEVARRLNLKTHKIARTGVELAMAGDVEGHVGMDGRRYMLDTARVFPPRAPVKTKTAIIIPATETELLHVVQVGWGLGCLCSGYHRVVVTLHASQVPLRSHPDHFIALLGADAQAPSVSTAKCCRDAGPGAVLVVRRTPADGTPGVLNQRASVYVGLRVLVDAPAVLPVYTCDDLHAHRFAAPGEEVRGDAVLVLDPPARPHLFQMLRPEAVKDWRTPLSADAFSGWGVDGGATHNREVREATQEVVNVRIPRLARLMDAAAAAAPKSEETHL